MIIVLRADADQGSRDRLTRFLTEAAGVPIIETQIDHHAVIALDGLHISADKESAIAQNSAVERVVRVEGPYKLVGREFRRDRLLIHIGDPELSEPVVMGRPDAPPVVIAGPCAVESKEQLLTIARAVKAAGASILRGGAYKPRTSPYQFQGLGIPALAMLAEARQATGLPVITEVMEPDMVDSVADHADVLQIGARNMQNFPLLCAVGRHHRKRPVMLKRGLSATIEEWLSAAEYIVASGNPNVILCERGIRSFDPKLRYLLDLGCVPLLRELTYLPVFVDPSHGVGRRELVPAMCRAGIGAGADGLILEVHSNPDAAVTDSRQQITPQQLGSIISEVNQLHELFQRAGTPVD